MAPPGLTRCRSLLLNEREFQSLRGTGPSPDSKHQQAGTGTVVLPPRQLWASGSSLWPGRRTCKVGMIITRRDEITAEAGFKVLRAGAQDTGPSDVLTPGHSQCRSGWRMDVSQGHCCCYYCHRHQQGSPSLVLQPALVKGVAKFSKTKVASIHFGVLKRPRQTMRCGGGGGIAKPSSEGCRAPLSGSRDGAWSASRRALSADTPGRGQALQRCGLTPTLWGLGRPLNCSGPQFPRLSNGGNIPLHS